MFESLPFLGAGAGEKKIPGAGQKWTGSATLIKLTKFQVFIGTVASWAVSIQDKPLSHRHSIDTYHPTDCRDDL